MDFDNKITDTNPYVEEKRCYEKTSSGGIGSNLRHHNGIGRKINPQGYSVGGRDGNTFNRSYRRMESC
ncbi:MAG: hypothetical protein PHU42_02065 [Patescibacteria group bacterium]|nr:hypothetical protein [Patescibacteria group bacterium]